MRVIGTATFIAAAVFCFSAHAAEPEYAMTCDEVITKLNREVTAEARARFADLEGSCMGVVDRDGTLFMHTKMVVRRVRGNTVTIYLPATDRTFDVQTRTNARIRIGNNRVRISTLNRGQELNIYVPVDELTQPIIDEVAFETDVEDELVVAPAVLAAALPTTG
jgi:hypothetical protein